MFRSIAGQQATMAAVLFSQVLDAAEAERVGLVWKAVADDLLLDSAVDCAARAAEAPSELTRRVKQTIQDMGSIHSHEEAVQRELEDQVWSMDQPAFTKSLLALQQRISSQGTGQ